jgi:predicted nucleic acid-binding protein
MADSRCLLDTNILLRWIKPDDLDYPVVTSAIEAMLLANSVLCYASQNLGEFWNTCTRPLDRNGFGLTPKEADRRARYFEDRLRLLPDSVAVHNEWRQILLANSVSGVQVHDARLVAVMRVHGVKRILSFNDSDFVRYHDIEAVNPRSLSTKHP